MSNLAEELVQDPEQYTSVSLPDFEGPLDLLLHLVKKHELDVFNIPIAFITNQYLKMLDTMRSLDMDIAGEYLLMAATLAYLKSRELLPREATQAPDEPEDDGLDPRQELIKRLLTYQKYKHAAQLLLLRPVVGRNVFHRGAPSVQAAGGTLDLTAPLQEIPVFALIEALAQVLGRSKVKLTHDVTLDRLSLAEKINELTERLDRELSFTFESCFDWIEKVDAVIHLRGQLVVTFMAVLEMTRLKLMKLHQPEQGGSLYITRNGPPPALRASAMPKPATISAMKMAQRTVP